MKYLEDILVSLGVILLAAGVGVIYWPASLIIIGICCLVLGGYLLKE
jgi:uncharacterized membrane protein